MLQNNKPLLISIAIIAILLTTVTLQQRKIYDLTSKIDQLPEIIASNSESTINHNSTLIATAPPACRIERQIKDTRNEKAIQQEGVVAKLDDIEPKKESEDVINVKIQLSGILDENYYSMVKNKPDDFLRGLLLVHNTTSTTPKSREVEALIHDIMRDYEVQSYSANCNEAGCSLEINSTLDQDQKDLGFVLLRKLGVLTEGYGMTLEDDTTIDIRLLKYRTTAL